MWTIKLGYLRNSIVFHWKLVFHFEVDEEDDSFDCSSDCDSDSGNCEHYDNENLHEELVNDNFIPIHPFHIVHVVRDAGQAFEYEHLGLEYMALDLDLEYSQFIGRFSNADLASVLSTCENVAIPIGDDNCQTWVYDALADMAQTVEMVGYKEVLGEIKELEGSGR